MPKITITEDRLTVKREPGDPKFYGVNLARGESRFLYWLKGILNKEPYNLGLIKKRMHKDGHMVDKCQQYLRTAKITRGKPYMMIYNDYWAISGVEEDWNKGEAELAIERGIGE